MKNRKRFYHKIGQAYYLTRMHMPHYGAMESKGADTDADYLEDFYKKEKHLIVDGG